MRPTWRDGDRTPFDYPVCDQAECVDLHGKRVDLRCFADCAEERVGRELECTCRRPDAIDPAERCAGVTGQPGGLRHIFHAVAKVLDHREGEAS